MGSQYDCEIDGSFSGRNFGVENGAISFDTTFAALIETKFFSSNPTKL
jgi:hypothetical protein